MIFCSLLKSGQVVYLLNVKIANLRLKGVRVKGFAFESTHKYANSYTQTHKRSHNDGPYSSVVRFAVVCCISVKHEKV